jgi:hypothetical protein
MDAICQKFSSERLPSKRRRLRSFEIIMSTTELLFLCYQIPLPGQVI